MIDPLWYKIAEAYMQVGTHHNRTIAIEAAGKKARVWYDKAADCIGVFIWEGGETSAENGNETVV